MKAYELKVSLKGAKPPIWRKIAVPININFMQLHNVIQEAMGWSNYHLYEFTFKSVEDIITNNIEACKEYEDYSTKEGKKRLESLGMLDFMPIKKTLYAKEVMIEDYLKSTTKFNYVYDFGDWWEHTIEVVSVIEDYEYEYPKVLKFRQLCPPEDSGGIYGYYELLEKYNNLDDPEHEDIVEWLGEDFLERVYDIDEVNEDLEFVLDDDFDFMEEFL